MKGHVLLPMAAVFLFGAACAGLVSAQSTRRAGIKTVKTLPSSRGGDADVPVAVADTLIGREDVGRVVGLADYQKVLASRIETLFITNNSAVDTIREVVVEIDYRTPQGRQLNRREVVLTSAVPPGQTRTVSFSSWDRQQMYYYKSTPPSRPTQRARAFDVTVVPLRAVVHRPVAE